MGRRGPAPTPTAILKARGSWRGEIERSEARPDAIAPPCPDWLSAAAAEVWQQMAAKLEPLGLLTSIDGHALARYCDVWVRWKRLAKFLEEKGEVYTIKDKNGDAKRVLSWPQASMYAKLAVILQKLEAVFGLTPSSRSRIQVDVGDTNKPERGKGRFFPAGPALRIG